MYNGNEVSASKEMSVDESVKQFENTFDEVEYETVSSAQNGFLKIAIGMLIGAAVGGIAGALTKKNNVDRVNQTVQGVGNSVRNAATSVSETVQEVGNAVNKVTVGVNDTIKDVGITVKGAADEVSGTVEITTSTLKNATEDVWDTIKTTIDAVQNTVTTLQKASDFRTVEQARPVEQIVETATGGMLYRLVPVSQDTTV